MRIWLLLLLVLVSWWPALAQTPSPSDTPTAIGEISAEAIRAERARTEEALKAYAKAPASNLPEAAMLRDLLGQYDRQLSSLDQLESARKALADLTVQLDSARAKGVPDQPPYKLSLLDKYQEELDSATRQLDTLKLAREAQTATLESAQKAEREAAQQLRLLRDDSKPEALQRAELAHRVAQETLLALQLGDEAGKLQVELAESTQALRELQVAYISERLTFSRGDLEEKKIEIEKRRKVYEADLNQARIDLEAAENRASAARTALDEAHSDEDAALARLDLEASQEWVQTRRAEVEIFQTLLAHLDSLVKVWERRYLVRRDEASNEDLVKWEPETRGFAADVERLRQVHEAQLLALRAEAGKLQSQEGLTQAERSQLSALNRRVQITSNALTQLAREGRNTDRLIHEIEKNRNQFDLWEFVKSAIHYFSQFWNFELMVVGDRALTPGKLLVAMVVVFLGLTFSKRSLTWVKQHLGRLGLEPSVAAALERVAYYVMFAATVLFAMHIVNIPLTLFTFLGGGSAIAIGFAAQNILNNFISGLILMLEQPIRIGDMIELEGLYGLVQSIGARCTYVKTFSGVHVLVPNSKLLENRLINWTLGDDLVRTQVNLGVAYGSDTALVKRLLLKAVAEHPKIYKTPEPIVLFSDFGSDALMFEVYFWLRVKRLMDRKTVESDLRFRIDEMFRENSIQIPFAQRDVHLDAAHPLEVRLVPPTDEGRGEGED